MFSTKYDNCVSIKDYAFCTSFRDEESEWLKWIETELQQIAGNKTEITLQQFKSALNLKQVRSDLFIP